MALTPWHKPRDMMKRSLLAMALLVTLGSAQAVTISLTGIASTSAGLVTESYTHFLASGGVYFFSSATDLKRSDLDASEFAVSSDSLALFASKLGSDPGQVRGPVAFTNGAFVSTGSVEVGPAGNNVYMLIVGRGGFIGAFQTTNVPASGFVLISPSTVTEDLLGTSIPLSIGGVNSGYQLVGFPEPSTALLSLLGIVPLIRRRR
jgi:hypothetical protein